MTTHHPPTEPLSGQVIDDEIEAIVRLYRRLGEQVAQLTQERQDLAERFSALVPLGYRIEVDGAPATKMPANRAFHLDTGLELARVLGLHVREHLVVDVVDLKARLKAAGRIDDAMLDTGGKPRVSL